MSGVPTLGEIRLFAGAIPSTTFLPCDGRTLSLTDNLALFGQLEYRFGGSGQTFGIPNLAPLASTPVGQVQYAICFRGRFPAPGTAIDGMVGAIRPLAMSSVPANWAPCNGSSLASLEFQDLFVVLNDQFGNSPDGTTFALPNLAPLVSQGVPIPYFVCTHGFLPKSNSQGTYLDFLGGVYPYAGDFSRSFPNGAAVCNGLGLNLQQELLGPLLGSRFGGDNSTYFQLPNLALLLSGTVSVNYLIWKSGLYPS